MGKPIKNEAPIERVETQSPDLREELLARRHSTDTLDVSYRVVTNASQSPSGGV